jgi:hypothetical protein
VGNAPPPPKGGESERTAAAACDFVSATPIMYSLPHL